MKIGDTVQVKATGQQGVIDYTYASDKGTVYHIVIDTDREAFCVAEEIEESAMKTYAVMLVDRFENGKAEAFRWLSKPDTSIEDCKEIAAEVRVLYGDLVEIHPTTRGFNVWNVDIR